MHEDGIESTEFTLSDGVFEIEEGIEIIVGTTLQLIDPSFANKRVRSAIALQSIVAGTTAHKIATISRKHSVIARACSNNVGSIAACKRF
jgi:hypothetical protein